jgi:hypothetical protein
VIDFLGEYRLPFGGDLTCKGAFQKRKRKKIGLLKVPDNVSLKLNFTQAWLSPVG